MATKRILVLSGGGSRGAFQAGAVTQLLQDLSFDAYFGVSVGSLNAILLAGHPDKQTEMLEQLWRTEDPGVVNHYERIFQSVPCSTLDLLREKCERGATGWVWRTGIALTLAIPRLISRIKKDVPIIKAHARVDAAPPLPLLEEGDTGGGARALVDGLAAAFQDDATLKHGLPLFQSLDNLEKNYLRNPEFVPSLQALWDADAPLYVSFVCLYDGRFITATTHRSMQDHAEQLPGFLFLDPALGWNDQDLHDCIIASAAIPVRMTLRGVRVPDLASEGDRHVPGPGPVRRVCADGGLRSILPLAEGIWLAEAWAAEGHDTELWAVTNANRDRTLPLQEHTDPIRRLTRFLTVMEEEILSNDFKELRLFELAARHQDLDALRGSRLGNQVPERLIAAGKTPPLYTIEPQFTAPWSGHEGKLIDDLFANIVSFEAEILEDRWAHGQAQAANVLNARADQA